MSRIRVHWGLSAVALALLAAASQSLVALDAAWGHQGQEHPEEHPSAAAQEPVAAVSLAAAITAYVHNDAHLKGGYFLLYDPAKLAPLALTLDHVHRDRLSRVGKDRYFACADFTSPEGKAYDLDFFLEGPGASSLEVSEIMIHKEAGVERYTWVEEGGLWKRRPIGPGK